ncbi:MAG: ATP-binding cassette domain-containing protein [Acidilobaceae archaeon]|nr:ATP-binding cassette domain-containing protein [Acidilobaceae archaeon]MCX8165341.1 ATP-binding cassette domain-containing protein [Acidilobaceae archaeon]MDW7973767.1 ATP-binding cassette domain-containing protein [Sulfolobales archaeon]
MLLLERVTVVYPNGLKANDEVTVEIRGGEILALLGENGAGKTTLAKVAAGLLRPTAGSIFLDGEEVRFESYLQALRRGIYYVSQEPQLIEGLTVLEDVGLTLELGGRGRSRGELRRELARLSAKVGLRLEPEALCEDLSAGERQRVEALKPFLLGSRIVIFDEPTTHMSPLEARALGEIMREMRREGKGIVFITHKMKEVLELADRVVVMRRGRVVGELERSRIDEARLLEMMFGEVGRAAKSKGMREPGEVLLELRDVSAAKLRRVSLRVSRGEVVGVAGVAGNGQRELFEVIAGLRRAEKGKVLLGGSDVTSKGPGERARLGLSLVPEDRLGWALVPGLDVATNVYFALNHKRFFLDWREVRRAAESALSLVPIVGSPSSRVESLSGGNMQRLVLARELFREPKVLVAMNPTAGLDHATTVTVREMIVKYSERGGVLLISEDLDELAEMADRIYVMSRGSIVGEHAKPFDLEKIAEQMVS